MSNNLVEYIKLHKISLEQDFDNLRREYTDSDDYNCLTGQISVLDHILEVAAQFDNTPYERL